MYTLVFLTTLLVSADRPAQPSSPPPSPPEGSEGRVSGAQERLVPIPQSAPVPYVADKPVSVGSARPDVVLQWNEVHLQAIRRDRTPPPRAARNLAIVHAAIYDAVNAVERTHRPYRVDARVAGAVSIEAAAAVAAHRALVELYPAQAEQLDAALDVSLQDIPDGQARAGGVALGPATGVWRPTPPNFRPGLLPQWRYLAPFAIPNAPRFNPPAPPVLNSAAYAEAFNDVKELGRRYGSRRTPEQTSIALFWNDDAGSVTPPGHWNQIAQTVSRQRGLGLADNARLFALLNVCLADAAIVCWEGKFGYSYWRPITAIHEADADDNPETTPDHEWDSLLTTPPFPSYPSGHSTFSGAGATALARFFGTDDIRFTVGSEGTPDAPRTFAGFWHAAQEAGRSRIYGGIHYEFDNQEGLRCGRELADSIARRYFIRVRQ
jgi:hypothetical protein